MLQISSSDEWNPTSQPRTDLLCRICTSSMSLSLSTSATWHKDLYCWSCLLHSSDPSPEAEVTLLWCMVRGERGRRGGGQGTTVQSQSNNEPLWHCYDGISRLCHNPSQCNKPNRTLQTVKRLSRQQSIIFEKYWVKPVPLRTTHTQKRD